MTPRDFCYWLNGLLELHAPKTLNAKQVQMVKDHLALVFTKLTPEREVGDAPPVEEHPMPDVIAPLTLPQSPPWSDDPFLPYRITCKSGSGRVYC